MPYCHCLRSGKHYQAVSLTDLDDMTTPVTTPDLPSTSSTTTTTTTTTATTTTNMTTIKLLHQDPSLKRFSGEDPLHSPLIFLQQCEDVMSNSNVTNDTDKISFIRSQLVQDSLASVMMRANCFNTSIIGASYIKFKDNFLRTFGTTQDDSSLQWSFRLADTLTTTLGTLGYLRGQAHAADFANEAIAALQAANWVENGVLTVEKLRTVLEFQYYAMFLTPQERRIASSLDFKPDHSLIDFASKLGKKVRDAHKAPIVPVAPVEVKPKPSMAQTTVGNATTSARAQSQPTRTLYTCSYCGKPNHSYARCYKRRAQAAKATKQPPSSAVNSDSDSLGSQPPPAPSSAPSRVTPAPRTPVQPSAPPAASKWCHVHEFGSHTTDECFTILRIKRNTSLQSSGEAPRQAPNHPG